MLQAEIQNEIILIADPKHLAIPTQENHDPLIDIKDQMLLKFGPSPEIPNNTNYTKMRSTVYNKLLAAQKQLPHNLKFCLYEGYRSLELQEQLFNERYHKIKTQYPTWTLEQIFIETIKMVSPVINLDGSPNIPPHSTGGAVDVYLINEKQEIVDMGIKVEDWMKDLEGTISQTDSDIISDQAKIYRKIMNEALSAVGFVNYPTEYWHWSYGDRYWASHQKKDVAIYDSI